MIQFKAHHHGSYQHHQQQMIFAHKLQVDISISVLLHVLQMTSHSRFIKSHPTELHYNVAESFSLLSCLD